MKEGQQIQKAMSLLSHSMTTTHSSSEAHTPLPQASSKVYKLVSTKKMFELFNKKQYKCQGLVVPETITVSTVGALQEWYFQAPNSSKSPCNYADDYHKQKGCILKRNHLTEEFLFLYLYSQSLIGQHGIEAFVPRDMPDSHLR